MNLINIKRLINLYIKLSNDPLGKSLSKNKNSNIHLKISSNFKVDELNLISQLLISNNLATVSKEIDSKIIKNEEFKSSISFFSKFLIHQRTSQWYSLRHPNEELFNEHLSLYYKSKDFEREFSDIFSTTFLLPPELSFTRPITQILQNHKSHTSAKYKINTIPKGIIKNSLILNKIISLIIDNKAYTAVDFISNEIIISKIEPSQFQDFILLLHLILSSKPHPNLIKNKDVKKNYLGLSASKSYFKYFQLKALLKKGDFSDKWSGQSKVFRNAHKDLIIAYRFSSNQTIPLDIKNIKSHLKRLRILTNKKNPTDNYQKNLYITILFCKKKLQKNEKGHLLEKKKNAPINNLDYRDIVYRNALIELIILTYSTPQKKISLSKLYRKLKKSKSIHLAVSKERELIPYEELFQFLKNHVIQNNGL